MRRCETTTGNWKWPYYRRFSRRANNRFSITTGRMGLHSRLPIAPLGVSVFPLDEEGVELVRTHTLAVIADRASMRLEVGRKRVGR